MGILVADRKFFGEIGSLDGGMKIYGGENVELGIRVRFSGWNSEETPYRSVSRLLVMWLITGYLPLSICSSNRCYINTKYKFDTVLIIVIYLNKFGLSWKGISIFSLTHNVSRYIHIFQKKAFLNKTSQTCEWFYPFGCRVNEMQLQWVDIIEFRGWFSTFGSSG